MFLKLSRRDIDLILKWLEPTEYFIFHVFFVLWRGMLPREGKGGRFPYLSVFDSTVTKTDR